jgi:predicted metalloprotease with PDZ domain
MLVVMTGKWFNLAAALLLVVAAAPANAAKYEGLTATIDKPIAAVQQAANNALAVVGVELKTTEATFLEGVRKRKVGAFVGSGGEVISVTLVDKGGTQTEVTIRTKKTFVGRAGQKVWDQPVLDEINKAFAPAAAQ